MINKKYELIITAKLQCPKLEKVLENETVNSFFLSKNRQNHFLTMIDPGKK